MTVLYFIVTLGLLIAFHEFGHFWVARRCGVKVHRFSIGFGPALFRWKDKLNTEYVLAAVPLGGYVKMLDEREGPVESAELDFAFNRKSSLARTAIVAAGPLANFVLAVLVYWLVMLIGFNSLSAVVGNVEPDSIAYRAGIEVDEEIVSINGRKTSTREQVRLELLRYIGESQDVEVDVVDWRMPNSLHETKILSLDNWLVGAERVDLIGALGLSFYQPSWDRRIDELVPGGAAEAAGLKKGDRFISIDGKAIDTWQDLIDAVGENADQPLLVRYESLTGHIDELTLTPRMLKDERGKQRAMIGVQVSFDPMPEEMIRLQRYNVWRGLLLAFEKTYADITLTLETIGKMLRGLISPSNISGPVSIAKIVSVSAESGVARYLQVLALLSVSLGVINLLPIPVLDGGHLLFIGVESLIRRPIPERIQIAAYQVGLLLVVSLMAFAIYNDIVNF